VTLTSDDLRQLPLALGLSRATMGTLGLNIALSIGVKPVFLALVLGGMGTSLLVTLNGMRPLGWRKA
jgi:Cd2+/Zn2+-exporting ATPase